MDNFIKKEEEVKKNCIWAMLAISMCWVGDADSYAFFKDMKCFKRERLTLLQEAPKEEAAPDLSQSTKIKKEESWRENIVLDGKPPVKKLEIHPNLMEKKCL